MINFKKDSLPWYAKRLQELAQIPIKNFIQPDAVLLDDTEINRLNWQIEAEAQNKKLIVFTSVQNFLDGIAKIARETPLYIDLHLDNDWMGDDLAKYVKTHLGFKEIYLTTSDPEEYSAPSWVNKIVGKNTPWIRN